MAHSEWKDKRKTENKTKLVFSTFSVFSICFKSKPINFFYLSLFALIICFRCFSLQPKKRVHFENRPDGSELSSCTTPRAGK